MGEGHSVNQEGFASISNVSRETLEDYVNWYRLLRKWNARINLVAPSTLDDFWARHALDSWQICPLLPDNPKVILDFGSGAGFPGIAAAIHMKHGLSDKGQGCHVHLVESAGKKASFLKTVIRELALPATVHSQRIESLEPMKADVITARAFAPLPRLFEYALPHLHDETILILPKGETVTTELEKASTTWTFSLETVKSITQDNATLLRVKSLKLRL